MLKVRLSQKIKPLGYGVLDFTPQTYPTDDYPDYGKPSALTVGKGKVDRYILICNHNIGIYITAQATCEYHDSNTSCLALRNSR